MAETEDDIALVGHRVRLLGALATASLNAYVTQLEPPLEWISELDASLEACRDVGKTWLQKEPVILGPVSEAFIDYAGLIAATAQHADPAPDSATWQVLLSNLSEQLRDRARTVLISQQSMADLQSAVVDVRKRLHGMVSRVSAGRDRAQAALVRVAARVQQLVDRLGALGDAASANDLTGGQRVVSTAATLTFRLVTVAEGATVEIPFLGIALAALSIGSSLEEVFATDPAVHALLRQLYDALVEEAVDVQALAAANGALTMLDALTDACAEAAQAMPRMNTLWLEEAAKVDAVRAGLRAGADPGSTTDLVALPAAVASWARCALVARGLVSHPVVVGPRVDLVPLAS